MQQQQMSTEKTSTNGFGNVVGFGCGEYDLLGPLGADGNDNVLTPCLLGNAIHLDVIQVVCGSSSLALTKTSEVFKWGDIVLR
jgi:hypothetical protein